LERGKRILVAPMDWGLGHATRCVPIIRALQQHNCEVIIASSGAALELLKLEFPGIKGYKLPAYNPVYPSSGSMVWKMAFQLPKFLKTISTEHFQTEQIVAKDEIDVVISDNRYGCFSKKVKSIFITHQLSILMPAGYKWLEPRVNHFNTEQIKQYYECWIPSARNSIVPALTNGNTQIKTRHIGFLSRFESKHNIPKKYDVLVICSGPEPQRTTFENMMMEQLRQSTLKSLLVKGLPGLKEDEGISESNLVVRNFMNANELNEAIEASDIIISRSGYSTIMDLAKLGKQAIFVPTPNQTEQEYIAKELMQRGIAFSIEQSEFNLNTALLEAKKFAGFEPAGYNNALLEDAIQSILLGDGDN
jgi:uncharacterized protein (TIGR00661 family)